MNWNASGDTHELIMGVVQPELGTRHAPASKDSAGDWLCAWCHQRVANERDRFSFDGQDEFTFTNPEGIRFDIITFSEAQGCRQVGVATLDHTWFAGHAWSYCLCKECGQHLGWYYAGQHSFVGLIRSRIVRALYVRN